MVVNHPLLREHPPARQTERPSADGDVSEQKLNKMPMVSGLRVGFAQGARRRPKISDNTS